jgi:hypothetical protein
MEKLVTLKGVTLMWACLQKPNNLSNKYQVDVLLNDEQAKQVEHELALEIRHDEEKGKFVTAKSKFPIKPLDTKGNIIEALVGNGSKANLLLGSYDWVFKNKKGKSPGIAKMVVTELVEYKPGESKQDGNDDDSLFDIV